MDSGFSHGSSCRDQKAGQKLRRTIGPRRSPGEPCGHTGHPWCRSHPRSWLNHCELHLSVWGVEGLARLPGGNGCTLQPPHSQLPQSMLSCGLLVPGQVAARPLAPTRGRQRITAGPTV